jgi:hypothetical protein
MVAIGGWRLASTAAPAWTLFALAGDGMVVLGRRPRPVRSRGPLG